MSIAVFDPVSWEELRIWRIFSKAAFLLTDTDIIVLWFIGTDEKVLVCLYIHTFCICVTRAHCFVWMRANSVTASHSSAASFDAKQSQVDPKQ